MDNEIIQNLNQAAIDFFSNRTGKDKMKIRYQNFLFITPEQEGSIFDLQRF